MSSICYKKELMSLRRNLYGICLKDFLAALAELGYRKARPDKEPCLNWRRERFHVILHNQGRRRLSVSLHIDVPTSLPPFHRAIKGGKHLEYLSQELNRIIESYKKVRRKNHEKSNL